MPSVTPPARSPYVKSHKCSNSIVRYMSILLDQTVQRFTKSLTAKLDKVLRAPPHHSKIKRNNRKQSKAFAYKLRNSYLQTTTVEYSSKSAKNEGALKATLVKLTRSARKHANSVKSLMYPDKLRAVVPKTGRVPVMEKDAKNEGASQIRRRKCPKTVPMEASENCLHRKYTRHRRKSARTTTHSLMSSRFCLSTETIPGNTTST